MSSVIKALNAAYDRIETRPVWKVRLTAVLLVLASGFALAGLFLLVVFGGPIGEAIADQAGLGSAFELIWALLRWPIAFAGLLLFFALVFYASRSAVPGRAPKPAKPGQRERRWRKALLFCVVSCRSCSGAGRSTPPPGGSLRPPNESVRTTTSRGSCRACWERAGRRRSGRGRVAASPSTSACRGTRG